MTEQENPIINRVASSPLQSIDLKQYLDLAPRATLDLKLFIGDELLVREKVFRDAVKAYSWEVLRGNNVAVINSADVIMPQWTYLLIASQLSSVASYYFFGEQEELEKALFSQQLSKIDASAYEGAKVVIKGCSDIPVPEFAYMELIRLLRPFVSSIMYGEPCSTVPVFKRPRIRD